MSDLNEKIKIEISEDKMNAYVIFEKPEDEGELLTREQILDTITKSGIKKGLDNNLIDIILDKRLYAKKYLIAKGLEPEVGEDGYITIMFDTSEHSLKPKILENGVVDYRNLDNIKMAKAGEILAKMVLPTIGADGYDIFGEILPGKEGKSKKKLPKGKGTIISEDGLKLIAEVTGKIVYINDKVSVSQVHEVMGDVGVATGNINFDGTVIVRGNVMTDFSIKATGNVEIFGVVEGAEVYSGGNIFVSKGIAGMHKAYLEAGGNLTCKLIQDATITTGQDVFAEGILHSKLKVKGKIELKGRKGLLVGGKVSATYDITAITIGSPMGTNTEIQIGLDGESVDNYNKLKAELSKLELDYQENVQYLNNMVKKKDTIAGKKEIKVSLLNTVNKTKSIKSEMDYIEQKLEVLRPLVEDDKSKGALIVEKIIYPGVSIQIGNSVMTTSDEVYKSKFRNHEGQIKISPIVR